MTDPVQVPDPTYQDKDIRIGIIMIALGFIAVFVLLSFLSMKAFFRSMEADFYANQELISERAAERQLPPAPALQVFEKADWKAFLAEQQAVLHASGITDEAAGTGQIPIEQAKKLILERGVGAFGQGGSAGEGAPQS